AERDCLTQIFLVVRCCDRVPSPSPSPRHSPNTHGLGLGLRLGLGPANLNPRCGDFIRRRMELTNTVALVTGASRGVGRAVAVALAQAGVDVACAARATDDAPLKLPGTIDATVREIEAAGRRALAIATNLALEADVERMVRRTIEHFGRIDILINNAAITFPGDLALPMKRYDLIMAVNLRAALQAIQLVIADMKPRRAGAIINVSSAAGLHPYPALMA